MAVTLPPPTLYEYYTSGGITSGLSVDNPYFTLNGKNITLFSGAMHYFRVPPEYWRNRLHKMKAAGLNAVETYIPWNLHEPQPNNFDFGSGGSDMEQFLQVEKFLTIVQEEDLLAIVRPGPFICAEWEFGGLPSWLLREKDTKLRTSDNKFMNYVAKYFNVLLKLLIMFQFVKGGPIIAFQIENEYGSTEKSGEYFFKPDKIYLEQLTNLMHKNGIEELLFTSDSPLSHGNIGTLSSLFQTANFNKDPELQFDKLKELQKNKPMMAMEFWTGWFDHWFEKHNQRNNSDFEDVLERILKYPASVNLYMFHGGTNWGFMNGANIPSGIDNTKFQPDTTSYDYDAPLSEAGDYTEKYYIVKRLITKYNKIVTKLPPIPKETERRKYDKIKITQKIDYTDIIKNLPVKLYSDKILPMELLPKINNNSGQSYGYIIYRKENFNIKSGDILQIKGQVYDTLFVLINNKLINQPLKSTKDLNGFGYWRIKNGSLPFTESVANATLDLIVGNLGRNNFGFLEQFQQFKGLRDNVYINNAVLNNWVIIPMEFKSSWINNLIGWTDFDQGNLNGATLYKAIFNVNKVEDTYLDMRDWNMGIVMVNGFVLGRYAHLGPQQTLYLPAPLFKKGSNNIIVFEHFKGAKYISFSDNPIFYFS